MVVDPDNAKCCGEVPDPRMFKDASLRGYFNLDSF